jgi:hypothetical protein
MVLGRIFQRRCLYTPSWPAYCNAVALIYRAAKFLVGQFENNLLNFCSYIFKTYGDHTSSPTFYLRNHVMCNRQVLFNTSSYFNSQLTL